MSRVGQSYLIGHGRGRTSLRVVVEQHGESLLLLVIEDVARTVYFDEDTLSYWDELASRPGSNIKRLT